MATTTSDQTVNRPPQTSDPDAQLRADRIREDAVRREAGKKQIAVSVGGKPISVPEDCTQGELLEFAGYNPRAYKLTGPLGMTMDPSARVSAGQQFSAQPVGGISDNIPVSEHLHEPRNPRIPERTTNAEPVTSGRQVEQPNTTQRGFEPPVKTS